MSDDPGDAAVTFAPDDRPAGIEDVELAVFEGEAVLFDVQASMVHLLNAVAGATWLCCDGETTVAAMVDELADTFSVTEPGDRTALETAVHDSLARFADEGLLADHPRPARLTFTPEPVLADDGTEIVVAPPDP
jgi:hypothetical protein